MALVVLGSDSVECFSLRSSIRATQPFLLMQQRQDIIHTPHTTHRRYLHAFLASSLAISTLYSSNLVNAASSDNLYSDKKNSYELRVPSEFNTLPPKKINKEVSSGLPEEVLFQSQNFALGATISVTRTNSPYTPYTPYTAYRPVQKIFKEVDCRG